MSSQTFKAMKKYLLLPVSFIFFLQGCSKDDEKAKEEVISTISCFNINNQYFFIGDNIYIENCSSNAIAYAWLVNGNEVSTDKNFNYVFESEGTYTLTLRAYKNGEVFTYKEEEIVILFPFSRTIENDYLAQVKRGYATGLHEKNNAFYFFEQNETFFGANRGLYITKYDQNFNQQWKKLVYNTNDGIRYTSMIFLDSSIKVNLLTSTDNFVIELDLDGNYINVENPVGTSLKIIERDNRFFQVGYGNIFPHEGAISEFSSAGVLLKENMLSGQIGESLFVSDIQIVDGIIYALIGTYETTNDIDFYVATLDNDFNILSTVTIETNMTDISHPELIHGSLKHYGGKLYTNINGKLYRIDGGSVDLILVAPNFNFEIVNNYLYIADAFSLFKYDLNGSLIWKRQIVNNGYTYNVNIVNNNIIFDRTYIKLEEHSLYGGLNTEYLKKSYIGMLDNNGTFVDISQ